MATTIIDSLAPDSNAKSNDRLSIRVTVDFSNDTVMFTFPLSSPVLNGLRARCSRTHTREVQSSHLRRPDDQCTNTITPSESFQLFKTCRRFENPHLPT